MSVYGAHDSDSDSDSNFGDSRQFPAKGAYEDGDDLDDVPQATQRPLPKKTNAPVSEDEDEMEERRDRVPKVAQSVAKAPKVHDEERRAQKPPSSKARQQTLAMASSKQGASKPRADERGGAAHGRTLHFWCQSSNKLFVVPKGAITVAGEGFVNVNGAEQLGMLMTKGAEAVWKNVKFDESKVYVLTVRIKEEYVISWHVRLTVPDDDSELGQGSRGFLVQVPNKSCHAAVERWEERSGEESALVKHLPKKERSRFSPTQIKWENIAGVLTDMCNVVMPPRKERHPHVADAEDIFDAAQLEDDTPSAACPTTTAASAEDDAGEIRFGAASAADKKRLFAKSSEKKSTRPAPEEHAASSEATEAAPVAEAAPAPAAAPAAAPRREVSDKKSLGKRAMTFTFDDTAPKRRVPPEVTEVLGEMPAWVTSVKWTMTME